MRGQFWDGLDFEGLHIDLRFTKMRKSDQFKDQLKVTCGGKNIFLNHIGSLIGGSDISHCVSLLVSSRCQ